MKFGARECFLKCLSFCPHGGGGGGSLCMISLPVWLPAPIFLPWGSLSGEGGGLYGDPRNQKSGRYYRCVGGVSQHALGQTPLPWADISQYALGKTPPPDGHCSGQYASYWNVLLLKVFSQIYVRATTRCVFCQVSLITLLTHSPTHTRSLNEERTLRRLLRYCLCLSLQS